VHPPQGPGPSPHAFLNARLHAHRPWLWLTWSSGLGAALATVTVAGTIAWLVHQSLLESSVISSWPWLALALVAVTVRYGLQTLGDWSALRLAQAVRKETRDRLLGSAMAAGPARVATQGHSGAWANRYQDQVEALGGYFSRYLPALGLAFLIPLALLVAVFALDWVAGLLLLLSAPLIPIFMALIGMGSQQVHEAQQEQQNRLAGHFLDRIRALDLLRRSLAIGAARQEVAAAAQEYRRLSMRVLRVAFLSSAVMEFFSAVAIGLVAIYVGFALLGFLHFGPAGEITLFEGLFVLLLAPEYFQPLRRFAQSYHDRAGAIAAATALAPLLNGPSARTGRAEDIRPVEPPPVLHLSDVSLRYPPGDKPALERVSLEIAAGEQVAVVGPSGSGKSTLLAVCAGFLTPGTGSVQRSESARHFAWIGQRSHLFHGTLRDNLLLGTEAEMADEKLLEALATAGLPVTDPMLPEGLDTRIGEMNRGLSGGQAQRVALARALLSGSRLWLLDEPTSALDPDTAEDLLQRLLRHVRARGISLLIATHQEAVWTRMQRRVDLEHGRVRATGDV
jgi:ATP-binding cassette subfamily C protein CydD